MDRIMVFGFISAFLTLVFLGYRNQLTTRLPVIAASLACCALYGFLTGSWLLGFCLIAVTAEEIQRWLKPNASGRKIAPRYDFDSLAMPLEHESRLTRMFGRN
jgi:hypothetical protein